MVSAITKHTLFVCVVGDQPTTSRKKDVLPVDSQLLGPGNVSLENWEHNYKDALDSADI